jgi:hypothetical protein
MDTKKIGEFLKSVEGAEFTYLEWVVGIRSHLSKLRTKSKLDAIQFAEKLDIAPEQLDNFMLGDYEYTLKDICAINYLAKEIAIEEAAKTEVVSVAKNDYKYSKPLSNDTEGKS